MAEYAVVNKTQLDADMTSVADTIRTKGGTSEKLSWPDGYNAAIEAIQTGGGAPVEVEEKDVNFYDYDGTLLYSYTLAEAQALTELPPGPEHEGLTFQEWNCTLEEIQTWNQPLDVGASHITDDGKTRIYIRLIESEKLVVPMNINQTVENGIEIDWGDGSYIETVAGTGAVSPVHEYAETGCYKITLNPVSGNLSIEQKLTGTDTYFNSVVQKVEIGRNVSKIGRGAFEYSRQLKTITIPATTTNLGSYFTQFCSSLKWLVIPRYATRESPYTAYECGSLRGVCWRRIEGPIGNRYTGECASLRRLTYLHGLREIGPSSAIKCVSLNYVYIPETVHSINSSAFEGCETLPRVVLNGQISSVSARAFYGCTGMKFYDFTKCTEVPTLENINAFTNIPATCEIRVPAALYDEWIAATNWSTYAANIVGV